MRAARQAEDREAGRDEGRGRRVRRAHGGAREARVPEAAPRLHLRHVQRVRRQAPVGGQENIRPKSVAREMFERFCSFDEYVRDYGLERSEGVLLRYLSRCLQGARADGAEALRDRRASTTSSTYLRAIVRPVDSSLLDEWESLREAAGGLVRVAAQLRPEAVTAPPPRRWHEDPRALAVRAARRAASAAEALARKRWEEALAAASSPATWTAERSPPSWRPTSPSTPRSTSRRGRAGRSDADRAGSGAADLRRAPADPRSCRRRGLGHECLVDPRAARATIP